MIKVTFHKWHPSVEVKEYPNLRWDEVIPYNPEERWQDSVDILIMLGYYIGMHFDEKKNLITVVVDTAWFGAR